MADESKLKPENYPDPAGQKDEHQKREKAMDKTLEDSYRASDPPSTIPDPEEDSEAA